MYGKSGTDCIVGFEACESGELPLRALFLFKSDVLDCDDWLSEN